jgi:quinol monooxygenase YgiN
MQNSGIRVVARFAAKPDRVEDVKRILSELVEPTRAEDGCVAYELLQNTQDPTDFTFVEEWTSQAALDKHLTTEHIKRSRSQTEGLLDAGPDVRVYKLVK